MLVCVCDSIQFISHRGQLAKWIQFWFLYQPAKPTPPLWEDGTNPLDVSRCVSWYNPRHSSQTSFYPSRTLRPIRRAADVRVRDR